MRLLIRLKELDEPAEGTQVGSSAMPYKRNPMRSERICSLARYLITLEPNAAWTAAWQWLERTLDDSANRRLVLPEAFLTADAILLVWHSVASGLQVYPAMIRRNLDEELPFMAIEEILLAAAACGGDRQRLHERLRGLSREAARRVKEHGEPNPTPRPGGRRPGLRPLHRGSRPAAGARPVRRPGARAGRRVPGRLGRALAGGPPPGCRR